MTFVTFYCISQCVYFVLLPMLAFPSPLSPKFNDFGQKREEIMEREKITRRKFLKQAVPAFFGVVGSGCILRRQEVAPAVSPTVSPTPKNHQDKIITPTVSPTTKPAIEPTVEKTVAPERQFALDKIGPQEVVFPEGWKGLTHFPDGQFSTLYNQERVYGFMAAATRGVMIRGSSLEKVERVDTVIEPSSRGAFDANYAGPGSVNLVGEKILMIYHGEYHYGPSDPNYQPGEYHAGVGLARYKPEEGRFEKLGQILSSPYPRPERHDPYATGVGQPSVLLDKEGKNLLCYYVEWPEAGNAYIALARCPVEKATDTGAWRKFDGMGFNQPGIGGKAAPVIKMESSWAGMPSSSFNEHLGKYLTVFNSRDGFYVTTSSNGINWERPSLLLRMDGVTNLPENGKPFIMYPSLITERMDTGRTGEEMSLIYAYTPKHPAQSHFMVGRKVTLS